ncbi:MAG: tRNA uridine(34) 5-carboxymethylaminomethyl modification radical SAM/GNAT enzyme Elp3 [Methanoregulaceae archaeon]|jgi:elongator complex protein 3
MDEVQAFREIISRILSLEPNDERIVSVKIEICRKYRLNAVPKNSAILAAALPNQREKLRKLLLVKPTRTLSGVAPIAVMTSPSPCPHGKCIPCPGGPNHPFKSPQSYTGEEPAARRAREHDYDPYRQVQARLAQFEILGHRVNKAELIVMGGTITARSIDYQKWFVCRCIEAMNEYSHISTNEPPTFEFETVSQTNELSDVRCVGITFETRPDWCKREHIEQMLKLGVTKVELGVQNTDNRILQLNRRGCTVEDTVKANRLLRDAGLKVGFHLMPNLPGSDITTDRKMFETIFSDSQFRPDFLKIYPTLVTPGSEIEQLWRSGKYIPYNEEEMIDLVAYAKSLIPEYTRLQRIQRDIPAKLIVAGSRHSNFRQLVQHRLSEMGIRCRCIRCREIGRLPSKVNTEIQTFTYECCGGKEHFISSISGDSLIGFARLRFPSSVFSSELEGSALLRELHVYGSLVPLGRNADDDEYQHRSHGKDLLSRAEEISQNAGFRRIAIMSGVGVRPYYRRQGYERAGPYMAKEII